MQLNIDPRQPRPIYVQIMDEVRRLIVLGELSGDDALPSVRQLAADLRLNPNTIVQAYRELEREGVVYVRRGQGTFVSSQVSVPGERERLISELVDRVIVDARRNGVSLEELSRALADATKQAVGRTVREVSSE